MNQYLPHLISIRNEFGRFEQRDRNKRDKIIIDAEQLIDRWIPDPSSIL